MKRGERSPELGCALDPKLASLCPSVEGLQYLIQVFDLAFAYPDRSPVFHRFNWQVERGENWAIIGSSGCGKTTLLYLLAGLRKPSGGKIILEGEPLERPRSSTGLILQDYGLLPWSTVLGNVEVGLKLRQVSGKARKALARH